MSNRGLRSGLVGLRSKSRNASRHLRTLALNWCYCNSARKLKRWNDSGSKVIAASGKKVVARLREGLNTKNTEGVETFVVRRSAMIGVGFKPAPSTPEGAAPTGNCTEQKAR